MVLHWLFAELNFALLCRLAKHMVMYVILYAIGMLFQKCRRLDCGVHEMAMSDACLLRTSLEETL